MDKICATLGLADGDREQEPVSGSSSEPPPLPTRKEVSHLRAWRAAFGVAGFLTFVIGLGDYGNGHRAIGVAIFSLTLPLILIAAVGYRRTNVR